MHQRDCQRFANDRIAAQFMGKGKLFVTLDFLVNLGGPGWSIDWLRFDIDYRG